MTGAFIRVRCPDCDHEQVLFDRAATEVSCGGCGRTLARPTGGRVALEAEVTETVEAR